jgi:hypothetical protein
VNGSSVTVLGRGNAALYLNGQKITVDQLNNIPVDQILKFEIIRNPSARYDGDAAAVIKIITKNYRNEGTNIGLRQSLTYPPFIRFVHFFVGFDNWRHNKLLASNRSFHIKMTFADFIVTTKCKEYHSS